MTAREVLGAEAARWASEFALQAVCPHCGGQHPPDYVQVRPTCRRPPQRRPKPKPKALPLRTDEELRRAVLDALHDRPAASANEVTRRVPRQRVLVLRALRELEAAGAVRKNGAGGWRAA